MLHALPRLPPAAQMSVLRVLIDELGCGNLAASHSQLYRDLLGELGLPQELEPYLAFTRPELLEWVNVFSWMSRRATSIDLFLGALAYAEAIVPLTFQRLLAAGERLGLQQTRYWSEHIHIDHYHARDALNALRQFDAAVGLSYRLAWLGALMARETGLRAFRAAVEAAKKGERVWTS